MFAHVPKNAFTLTEIVISVTILGILSLIGVLSYSDSLFSSKDATRISDLGRIEVALRNEKQKSGAYPKPGEFFVLVASWTEKPVAYQGIFDSKACGDSLSEVPTDPVTELPYPYSVRTGRQTFQAAAIEEESGIRALVRGDYLPVAPTILPSVVIAIEAGAGSCVEIREGISWECGNGTENRKKFVLDGSRSNLPYDGTWRPVANAESFDAVLSEAWTQDIGSPRYRDCEEIRESADYFGGGEYRVVDEFWNKQTAICE